MSVLVGWRCSKRSKRALADNLFLRYIIDMKLVYDSRGKVPRFVVHDDAVVNQYTGDEVEYTGDWFPAYLKLYLKYRKDRL